MTLQLINWPHNIVAGQPIFAQSQVHHCRIGPHSPIWLINTSGIQELLKNLLVLNYCGDESAVVNKLTSDSSLKLICLW
jgi:hypothetical protein